jgi:magnesium-transporting ATPase (P-type)
VTNGQITEIMIKGEFKKVRWNQVKTGDIVRVEGKEKFPCDLIVLSSSEESGILYVETSSLGIYLN